MLKKILLSLIVLVLLALAVVYFTYASPRFPIITSYAAKSACTNHFVAKRPLSDIAATDLNITPINLATVQANEAEKSITASVLGLNKTTAIYKKGFGCVLLRGEDDYDIAYPPKAQSLTVSYPAPVLREGSSPSSARVGQALDIAFGTGNQTRAVLVIQGDSIIGERYAEGISAKTPLHGWSMTKSFANTLIGMLVHDGIIRVDDDHLFEEWDGDERSTITLDHLLRMTSGLQWSEVYDNVSDATQMLFESENVAAANLGKPIKHKPGTHWYYSSGTTNLLSGYLRRLLEDDKAYWRLLEDRLFEPLGMYSAFVEPDESGNFILSSYGYATARDWAKYGMLYLQDGVWKGERLLPEGWVDYTRKLTPASGHEYGAQFWLNHDKKTYPSAPADMFSANGFQGQRVFVIPSKNMVVVRLGINDEWDADAFFSALFAS